MSHVLPQVGPEGFLSGSGISLARPWAKSRSFGRYSGLPVASNARPWMDPVQLGCMVSFSSTLMAPSRMRLDFSQFHGAVSL